MFQQKVTITHEDEKINVVTKYKHMICDEEGNLVFGLIVFESSLRWLARLEEAGPCRSETSDLRRVRVEYKLIDVSLCQHGGRYWVPPTTVVVCVYAP